MNDAQQQTSAVVDRNDSDVDSDDDVPMGLWGLCDRSRRWGRRWCGRGVFCVLWSSCALYSPPLPPWLVRNRPLLRAGPWANASQRDTGPCFLVEKSWFGTRPAKISTYLPRRHVAIR